MSKPPITAPPGHRDILPAQVQDTVFNPKIVYSDGVNNDLLKDGTRGYVWFDPKSNVYRKLTDYPSVK